MPTRLSIPALVAAGLLVGCAAPETSKGLIDVNGDGLPESVTLLNRPQDQQAALLHVEKIRTHRKIHELAAQSYENTKTLFSASRATAAETLASESRVARANIALIDAQLALARTGLLPDSESLFLDSDGDGLPDLLHRRLPVARLVDDKLALCLKIFEQSKVGHARAEALEKTGNGSPEETRAAAWHMHEAELRWLDAQMERNAIAHDADAR